jgi:hypothetical protein
LTFFVLAKNGKHKPAKHSRSFPFVVPADLLHFFHLARQAGDTNPVIRQFRVWIRQQKKSD